MEGQKLAVGWAFAKVGELVEVGPKNDCPDETKVGFVPLQRLGVCYLSRHTHEIRPWKEVKKGYTHFQNGDVLLARITPSFENGKAGIVRGLPNGVGAGSTEYIVCRPMREALDPRYLLAHFKTRSFLTNGEMVMTGAVGQQRVPKAFVLESDLPLAPFNEQRCIATKLDTTLAAVDACRQRLDGVAAILKRFRQAVLMAATSGELTREWREENLIYREWEEGCLHELLSTKPRNGYSPKPADRETAVKSLTLSATTSGQFKPEHFKYIDQAIPEESHLWLAQGDILIQRANTLEYVGISAIYNGPEKTFIYSDLMMKCRANDKVETQFLHFLLLAEGVRSFFRKSATGTSGNMPKINQQIVMLAPVRWPTLEEQLVIVHRAQELFTLADQLEARLTAASRIVDRLTPALLAKAFRGELVPQDPNDEPASVLLERIRAARQAEAAAGKPSRRGRSRAAANTYPIALDAAPVPPDLLSGLLQECGALSERALLAASELDPAGFRAQLELEVGSGKIRAELERGNQVLMVAGAPGFRKDVTPLVSTPGGLRT